MPSPSYELRDLTFGYNGRTVLHGLTHSFAPGLVHGIVGPNGSGKSTLLDLMAGHHQAESGSVTLGEKAIESIPAQKRSQLMALVPQQTDFTFPFTVFDAVLMGRHPFIPRFARPTQDDLDKVNRAMATADIEHLAERTPDQLSGGERQRTVFARALAQDTPCLLLDEPTAHMDIRHGLATMAELQRMASEDGRTVITVLHDLNLAAGFCDRLIMLHRGRIHSSGAVADVLTSEHIEEVFAVRATVNQIPGDNGFVITYNTDQR